MAYHNELGKLGELLAAKYLEAEGYSIEERNWRINRLEIDLIAKKDDTLIFVEVKTRSNTEHGHPEMAVTARKERLISAAATAYMKKVEHEWAIRFDIISVVMGRNQKPDIRHLEDAFFPGVH